jgi:hypothetical protein
MLLIYYELFTAYMSCNFPNKMLVWWLVPVSLYAAAILTQYSQLQTFLRKTSSPKVS